MSLELVAGHVRSQMFAAHLVDAKSSDKHTIKRLFEEEGKFGFSPPVIDLKDQGFSLVGGRLDYVNNRAVAVLVFKRRNHFINLYVWAADSGAEAGPTARIRQGFSVVNWTKSGMTFWAVSSLDKEDLQEFGHLFRDKAG
jgi:anti-sigma factor RsiW